MLNCFLKYCYYWIKSLIFFIELNTILSSLMLQQQTLHMKLESLVQGQQKIFDILLKMMTTSKSDICEMDALFQPKTTVEELEKLDETLKVDTALRKKLVSVL